MDRLRQELNLVADNAPSGSHKKVANKIGFSEQYIRQVRIGTSGYADNPDNRKLIQDCINEYRRLINKEITKLKNV